MNDDSERSAPSHIAPPSRREDVREIIHGVEVADPYRWLEDGASAETRAWIAAQQNYTAPFLNTPHRERLRTRLSELMRHGTIGTPTERNGYYFFARRRAEEQRYSICRRFGLGGDDEVLIDPNAMSADPMLGVELRCDARWRAARVRCAPWW
jgi:prolyl oligopeptidase